MALLMLFIRINKINWLQLCENSVMVKNQRMSSPGHDLASLSLHPPWSHYPDSLVSEPAGAPRQARGEGSKRKWCVGGGHRLLLSWLVIINRRAFVLQVLGGNAVCGVLMHEITFQVDKRFAEWSFCEDCASLFLFHEGILFVITFTKRIYSTSSHVFVPDSLVLLSWREVACRTQPQQSLLLSVLSGILSFLIRPRWFGHNMSCHAVT